MEHLERVKELAEEGIDESDESNFGFHGTSIEAIKYLAENGRLPITGYCDNQFHFYPNPGSGESENEALSTARNYANKNAFRNRLIKHLNKKGVHLDREKLNYLFLLIDSGSLLEANFFPDDKELQELTELLKITFGFDLIFHLERFVKSLEDDAKGVILSVRKKIMDLQIRPGSLDYDLVAEVKDGLPIDCISGIEPAGQFEWDEIFENDFSNVKLLY